MTDIKRLDSRAPGFREALEQLLTREAEADRRVETAVKEIIAAVRYRGDEALLEFEFSGRPLVELGDESPVYRAVAEMMTQILNGKK